MKKEVMVALRDCHAWSFDEASETDALQWAEAHNGCDVDWTFVRELHAALQKRRAELHEQENHQTRRRQWAAHKLCGLTYVKNFETAVRAAVRLFDAYDCPCDGAEDPATLVIREYVVGSEPNNVVLDELAKVADYHGHIRLARILRAGAYTEQEYRADKIQYALMRTARLRKRY